MSDKKNRPELYILLLSCFSFAFAAHTNVWYYRAFSFAAHRAVLSLAG